VPTEHTFPPTAATLAVFTADLQESRDITYATSPRQCVTHVRSTCRLAGADTEAFDTLLVAHVLRAMRKRCRKTKREPRTPITVWLMRVMLGHLRKSAETPERRALAAVVAVGAHGIFRSERSRPPARRPRASHAARTWRSALSTPRCISVSPRPTRAATLWTCAWAQTHPSTAQ
jgi:hypothetical protein